MASDSILDWASVTRMDNVPSFTIFLKPIQKSPQDEREYRIIRLANGLQATLVHDAKADKAAASLDVAVGHLSDPDDVPGLAHFCEHLLFMGTEQFPRENEYSEYLAKNNGSSNAYTSTTNTNYFFDVGTHALPQALARFSAFFHCPLFSPSCTSRELNAVDSENKKNLQNDMWRIFQLNKHLSKPGHVWRKFGSGNRESLSQAGRALRAKGKLDELPIPKTTKTALDASPAPTRSVSPAPSVASNSSDTEDDGGPVGRETRRRLVEWWNKEYCAGRMRLCVIGKESLEELSDIVSTLFSPIENRGRDPLPTVGEHPFGPNEAGTLVSVQTIMSFHAVEISFPVEYQAPKWRYKPATFIAHFLGHEGPGSLHSYLKKKGWITDLSSGSQNLGRGLGMLKATIYLTAEGFLHYREVCLAVFKYLSLMRSSKFPAWYQKELSNLSNIRFRYAEKRKPDDYAVWISEHMAWPVPRELVLSGPQLVWEWDDSGAGEKEIADILQTLRVSKGRAVLMARAAEFDKINVGRDLNWENEPWYGTTYNVERFDQAFVEKAEGSNDIPELFLPGPNEFIPTNLEVNRREVSIPLKRPHLIRETSLSSLWYKKDDQFWQPKASIITDIRSPLANNTARNSVLTRLYSDVVNDSLTEFAYDASLAGLTYSFAPHALGVFVALGGYNDKMEVLLSDVLQKVKGTIVEPERLNVMKEQRKRDWQNFFLSQTFKVSDYFGRYLLTNQQWRLDEKLKELDSVTAEEVQNHAMGLLAEAEIKMLVVGNIHKEEAIKLCDMTEKAIGSRPLPQPGPADQALILPEASNFIWQAAVPNPNEPNSALTYFVNIGHFTNQHLRVTAALLAQILSEPAFNVLRTKEQLGYIVSCSQWNLSGGTELGLRVVVQSERGPAYLERRVEAFLESMKEHIANMSNETFQQQKEGLGKKWQESPKNLTEEANRYWAYIDSGLLDFLRRDEDIALLDEITKHDIVKLFLDKVIPSSPSRAKLSVHLRSQKPRPQKVSMEAMRAFEDRVLGSSLGLGSTAWREHFSDSQPVVGDFVKFWDDALTECGAGTEIKQSLLAVIPELLKKFPTEEEYDHLPGDKVEYIKDIQAFRSSLNVTEPARPLVEWADLPISKL